MLCACGPPQAELRVANGADVPLLDPQLVTGAPEGRVLNALFEGLVRLDPRTLAPLPGLAQSWESHEGGRRWAFRLRPGLRWSDGRALDGSDVAESWLRLLDPSTGAPYREWLLPVAGAEAWCEARSRGAPPGAPPEGLSWSADTLEVEFVHPVPAFAEMCAYHALAPLPPELRRPLAERAPAGAVGCGPFRLVARRVRDRVRVEGNPHYWNADAVALGSIDFLTVESQFTALNLFLAGEAHYLPNVPGLAIPALLRRQEERRAAGSVVEFEPSPFLATYFYRFNTTAAPFTDPRVRRALSLAVDRRAIAAALGAGQPSAFSFVPPWIPGYVPPTPLGFDPEAARTLLAEAGHPGGVGLPVVELLYNSAEVHRQVAEALQDQWRRHLGLRTRLQNQEWKVFLDAQRRLQYQLSRSSWIGDYLDPLTFLEIFRTGHPNNRTGWGDARYDRWLDEARDVTDPGQRAALLARCEELLLREAPILPLSFDLGLELVSEEVAGFERNLRGYVDWGRLSLRERS